MDRPASRRRQLFVQRTMGMATTSLRSPMGRGVNYWVGGPPLVRHRVDMIELSLKASKDGEEHDGDDDHGQKGEL